MTERRSGLALPQTLYAETAAPAPDTTPLDRDRTVSVAIVGGGYTGLSSALHLAEQGVDVVVLEANQIGWGCSGRNGGQVNPGLKPAPDEVVQRYGPDLGARMVSLSYAAPARVFDLVERHGIACEARREGTLRASVDASSAKRVAALAEQCSARGMPIRHLDADAVAGITGTQRYRSALLDPRGGSLNPLAYARGLAGAALKAGATIHTATRALSIDPDGGGWRIGTGGATLSARHVVIGTNGYTDDLWPGLRQTVIPVFSAILASEPLPPEILAEVMPGRSVLYEAGWDTIYYRVDQAGRLLMGGRGPQAEPYRTDDYAHLAAYARKLWPGLAGVGWTHRWYGQIAVTADHYPHIVEPAPNAHLVLGYNGRGIAMATTMGSVVAKRILGAAEDAIDFPIRRTLEPYWFHDYWRTGVTARIAYGRIRDRLGV